MLRQRELGRDSRPVLIVRNQTSFDQAERDARIAADSILRAVERALVDNGREVFSGEELAEMLRGLPSLIQNEALREELERLILGWVAKHDLLLPSERSERYDFRPIETKWQNIWEATHLYRVEEPAHSTKFYVAPLSCYPSGDIHVGHWYAFCPLDTFARFKRMEGHNVLLPMGFDAFGLPAENAAIRNNIHPFTWTMANIERMRGQIKRMGAMFDWEREVITCLPDFYKWNQWFFLQFLKNGLAYRQKAAVDWCPNCNTTLAREQVWGEDRHCERCGTPVERRDLEQWFFRITRYVDELLKFDGLDWPERVKTMQSNWIGRTEGANILFRTNVDETIEVFTTRPDTVYGVTFIVLAPEHPLVSKLTSHQQKLDVDAYVEQTRRRTEIERTAADSTKSGVFTGAYCRNPYSDELIPVYVGQHVLVTYGTGAVMGVPAHDERDFEFARNVRLPIRVVVRPDGWDGNELQAAYTETGVMVNSGPFDGTPSVEGKNAIIEYGEARGFARGMVTYRLRDWLISRQRYWGTPIPIIYCPDCGTVPVPESDLPVLLPEDAEFLPTGESPLKFHDGFLRVACPICGKDAKRETDTMDTFVDSSWHLYRSLSPLFDTAPFNPSRRDWLPVDQYAAGIEHATMHLMYFRFFTKAMRDLGLIDFDEPAISLFNQGIILGPDGEKMSKSRGNVVNPDEYIESYGADTFRCYLMFIGPWNEGGPFRPQGIDGISRWLNRVWNVVLTPPKFESYSFEIARDLDRAINRTTRLVSEGIQGFRFHIALARLMEFTNDLMKWKATGLIDELLWAEATQKLVLLIAPFAPHFAEELWERLGYRYSVHIQEWPSWDQSKSVADEFALVIQINGKRRDVVHVTVGTEEEAVREIAFARPRIQKFLAAKIIRRVVYVPGRVMNILT